MRFPDSLISVEKILPSAVEPGITMMAVPFLEIFNEN
jgi:hypothetical protein